MWHIPPSIGLILSLMMVLCLEKWPFECKKDICLVYCLEKFPVTRNGPLLYFAVMVPCSSFVPVYSWLNPGLGQFGLGLFVDENQLVLLDDSVTEYLIIHEIVFSKHAQPIFYFYFSICVSKKKTLSTTSLKRQDGFDSS